MREVHNADKQDPLLQRARALDPAIEPASELWPAIHQQLGHRERGPSITGWSLPRLSIAAGLLICASSLMTLWLGGALGDRGTGNDTSLAFNASPAVIAVSSPQRAMGPQFEQTRIDLVFALEKELETLSPESQVVLAENLLKVDQAINDINAALDDNPNSELLLHLLLSAYTDQLTLLGDINGMTHASRAATERTEI